MLLRRVAPESGSCRRVQTRFQEKREAWPRRRANTRREDRTGGPTPYLPSNLSVIIFQSLIQISRRFTIRQTIMCDFLKASLLEIIADFAPINPVFWRIHAEDLAKKLQSPPAVALEIGENL